jgi:hypothetical protein
LRATGLGRTPAREHFTIDAIQAHFSQANYTTSYEIDIDGYGLPIRITATWTLELTLVDPAGAPDPATRGSGAEIDYPCNNKGLGVLAPFVDPNADRKHITGFSWTHPDPNSPGAPTGYNCDHTKMGPHGHQGLVTVVVTDGTWRCTAKYKGTNTGFSDGAGQTGPPTCLRA